MAKQNRSADECSILANRLFFAYVQARLLAAPRAWGDFDTHESPRAHSTRIAVSHKNRFAQLLSELDELPDAGEIRERWRLTMQSAERDIAAYLATNPQPGHLALA